MDASPEPTKTLSTISRSKKKAPRENVIKCWSCGMENDHYARNCPKLHDSDSSMVCNICKEACHFARTCATVQFLHCREAMRCDSDAMNVDPSIENSPCFARRFMIWAPSKYLRKDFFVESSKTYAEAGCGCRNARHDISPLKKDMLARVLLQAFFLGHGIRHNVVFDLVAIEGVYRISTFPGTIPNTSSSSTESGTHSVSNGVQGNGSATKLFANESFLMKMLDTLKPIALEPFGPGYEPGKSIFVLDEKANDDFEQLVVSDKLLLHVSPEKLIFIHPFTIIMGDHEGMMQDDVTLLQSYLDRFDETTRVYQCRLGTCSRLGSSCVAIMHYLLDKLHVCDHGERMNRA